MRLAPLLLLVACAPDAVVSTAADTADPGGIAEFPAPESGPTCGWTYDEVDPDTAFGALPTPAELLLDVLGPRAAELTWTDDGARTALAFELRDPGAMWIGTPSSDEGGCAPHLLVDATLLLATADGGLAEALAVTVRAESGRVLLVHGLPASALAGSWSPGASSADHVDLRIDAEIDRDSLVGALRLVRWSEQDDQQAQSETVAAHWR